MQPQKSKVNVAAGKKGYENKIEQGFPNFIPYFIFLFFSFLNKYS